MQGYKNEKEAFRWVVRTLSSHCWLTSAQIHGRVGFSPKSILDFLKNRLNHYEASDGEGHYKITQKEVVVFEKAKDNYVFSLEQVAKSISHSLCVYKNEDLPVPMSECYFKKEISYPEGLSVLTHLFLRSFKINWDFLIEKKEVSLSKDSFEAKLKELNLLSFFEGNVNLIYDKKNGYSLSSCLEIINGKVPDFKKVECLYNQDGDCISWFSVSELGVSLCRLKDSVVYDYSWELLARSIYDNKVWLLEQGPFKVCSHVLKTGETIKPVVINTGGLNQYSLF